jgi:outer membrane protein assembly factor BamD
MGVSVARRYVGCPGFCLFAVVLTLLSTGCAPKKPLTADEYFRTATDNFQYGALGQAIEEYQELLDQHPFSKYTEEAELKIAHGHYLLGEYAEAIVALSDFQRRYPTSVHLPFVGYYLGMCYVQQMGTFDRDQTAAQSAETYFSTVVQQYPESPFAELARQQLDRCRESLAEHEVYIAQFYARHGNNEAAQIRYLRAATRYGETKAAADGLLQLGALYKKQGQSERAALAYSSLVQMHPGSPQAVTARKRLDGIEDEDASAYGDPLGTLLAAYGRSRDEGSSTASPQPIPAAFAARGPAAKRALVPDSGPFDNDGTY